MIAELLLLASLTVPTMPCKPIDEYATAYMHKLHGSHLRELDPDQVQLFNDRPPPTDWHQVWLMDLEQGGMIFAGPGEDSACMVATLNPEAWTAALKHLEGAGT